MRTRSIFEASLFLTIVTFTLTACAPGFIIQAAYEESKILLNREPIVTVISDPATDPEIKRKLALVLDARKFAQQEVLLDPDESFTTYSATDKEALVWVVVGCKPTAFTPYTWWFPIVGSVPYKGYFSKEDAEKEARRLKDKGYEVSVRGADALSTLGWFNDPVLTTTLRNDDDVIANTVIHESVHSTVWIKDNVPFNESLANFVGSRAVVDFFKQRGDVKFTALANSRQKRQLELADVIAKLYSELDTLYKSDVSEEEKLLTRQRIFQQNITGLRNRYPKLEILKELNNSEILQLKFYLTDLKAFETLFSKHTNSWALFFTRIKEIAQQVEDDSRLDPFNLLKDATPAERR